VAATERMRRVNVALRQVIAETIGRELADPRLGFVTITHVEATQDLKQARVYYTVLSRRNRTGSGRALESARGILQARVAQALKTRHTPQLAFVYDEHQDRAMRLTSLIDEVTADLAPEAPGDEDDAP
jgi:ribosome-binding factor A